MAQNVRAIKSRIGNIEDIAQITKAMNAIAMTKVTRLKKRVVTNRPYIEGLEAFVGRLVGQLSAEAERPALLAENGSERVGIVVLNSDRGLCGRYKGDINRAAQTLWEEAGEDGEILSGGEKARVYFQRRAITPIHTYAYLYDVPSAEAAARIADDATALYNSGQVGRVEMVYMRFESDLTQRMSVESLFPIRVSPATGDALIEPDPVVALETVLPLYARAKVYAAMLETKTSEEAIRRQAMRNATDNAEDLLKNLTRAYNKARQQAITLEIAEIIGGSEALRTKG